MKTFGWVLSPVFLSFPVSSSWTMTWHFYAPEWFVSFFFNVFPHTPSTPNPPPCTPWPTPARLNSPLPSLHGSRWQTPELCSHEKSLQLRPGQQVCIPRSQKSTCGWGFMIGVEGKGHHARQEINKTPYTEIYTIKGVAAMWRSHNS